MHDIILFKLYLNLSCFLRIFMKELINVLVLHYFYNGSFIFYAHMIIFYNTAMAVASRTVYFW